MSQMVRKNYPELGEVKAPYVHSVKHGNTLYISGLTAFGTRAQQAGIGAQADDVAGVGRDFGLEQHYVQHADSSGQARC